MGRTQAEDDKIGSTSIQANTTDRIVCGSHWTGIYLDKLCRGSSRKPHLFFLDLIFVLRICL